MKLNCLISVDKAHSRRKIYQTIFQYQAWKHKFVFLVRVVQEKPKTLPKYCCWSCSVPTSRSYIFCAKNTVSLYPGPKVSRNGTMLLLYWFVFMAPDGAVPASKRNNQQPYLAKIDMSHKNDQHWMVAIRVQ